MAAADVAVKAEGRSNDASTAAVDEFERLIDDKKIEDAVSSLSVACGKAIGQAG